MFNKIYQAFCPCGTYRHRKYLPVFNIQLNLERLYRYADIRDRGMVVTDKQFNVLRYIDVRKYTAVKPGDSEGCKKNRVNKLHLVGYRFVI